MQCYKYSNRGTICCFWSTKKRYITPTWVSGKGITHVRGKGWLWAKQRREPIGCGEKEMYKKPPEARKYSISDMQMEKENLCGQRNNCRGLWRVNHKKPINLIMKPSLYLDLLMDFEQIYMFLNNHSGLGWKMVWRRNKTKLWGLGALLRIFPEDLGVGPTQGLPLRLWVEKQKGGWIPEWVTYSEDTIEVVD